MNQSGKISKPIGLAGDVYKVLEIRAKDGVYDIGYACSNEHGQINPWSKHKPVKVAVIGRLTADEQFEMNNCSMLSVKAVKTGTPPSLVCKAWTYDPPTGGTKEPFRITDFDGYNHKANIPIRLNTHEITYDKSAGIDSLVVSASFITKILDVTYSYGDTDGVDIPLNEVVVGMDRFIWWGLGYVSGNEILVANCDNNLDQSDKGYDYSPGVVKFADWKLGGYIQDLPAGSTIELVPFINMRPEGGGRPNGLDKNGAINAETALCFPDGRVLTIHIIESPTGIFTQASWALTGPITIYVNRGTTLAEIAHFGIIGSDNGAFGEWVGGAAAATALLYMEVHVTPKSGTFKITANQWQMDFSQFPQDAGYSIGMDSSGANSYYVNCIGIATTKGGTTAASMDISSAQTVYFVAEVTQRGVMQSFFTQKNYIGLISLRNSSTSQTAASATYSIPSSNTTLQ